MAFAGTTAATAAATHTSSYRIKFPKQEFLQLVEIAKPKVIYHVRRMFFFAFDGFVMYSLECKDEDLSNQNIINAIEFSNTQWSEAGSISRERSRY